MLGLAVLAAAAAVVVRRAVFPYGSFNNDEAIYRLQAQAIRHGHFFLRVVPPADAFRPWLAANVHHHWVLKYIPVEGGLLAAAGAIAGTANAALPVVAAAAAVATWFLVREVLQDRRSANVATALFVASPIVVVQSSILVGYLPTLVLLEVFAWSVIRATRRHSAVRSLIGGLAVGVAGVARPYDTVLFAAPVLAWAVVRLRRDSVGPLGWSMVGALPSVIGMLLYNMAATGSPWRLPFNLLEPSDRPGFGPRRIFPQDPYLVFRWPNGIRGSGNHLLLTSLWVSAGPILVVLAAVGIWRRRRSGSAVALAAVALALPVGYVFFWGAWNAAKFWRGVRFIGPFYFLPLVIPITAFGGAELARLYRRRRPLAVVAVVVGLASSTLVAAPAIAADARWSRQDGAVLAMVGRRAPDSGRTLVLIQSDQESVMHPISGLANRWDGAGPLLYGLWSGTTQDLAVLAGQADRRPYVLSIFGVFKPHPAHLGATLRPIQARSGSSVTVHVSAPAGAGDLTIDSTRSGAGSGASRLSCPAATNGAWDVTIAAGGTISCARPGGSGEPVAAAVASPTGGNWDGSLTLRAGSGPSLTLPVRAGEGSVTVLAVGRALDHVGRPPVGLLTAD